ncbi:unnamed protein product [Zymoseptoria tritici ST99CH_3D1]|nr:unnamed protein product [Zymoseptoria tritici ST99CH_3D1]
MQISRLSIILAVVSTSLGNDCTEDDPCYTCTGINQDLGPDGKFPDGACVGTGHVAGKDDSRIQPCDWARRIGTAEASRGAKEPCVAMGIQPSRS